MGRPKLLLPWGDGLLIDHVLTAWTASQVADVIVVVRRDDDQLTDACRRHAVQIVHPAKDPPDMKASVQYGLQWIEHTCQPRDRDRCFIAPADLPALKTWIIDRLIATESNASTIVLPSFGDKQGHPVRLPWPMTQEISQIGSGQGIDGLVKRHERLIVPFAVKDRVTDVDTWEEYQQLRDANHPKLASN